MADRQCGELFAAAVEQCIGADHERTGPQLNQGGERRIDFAFAARMQDMELKPQCAGRRLQRSRCSLGKSGTRRVDVDHAPLAVETEEKTWAIPCSRRDCATAG